MTNEYPFHLVRYEEATPPAPALLANRPFTHSDRSFAAEARSFVPGETLETAINTAIAVGEPLLLTGEPGTGKTQAAYYTAYKLGVEPVIHFQVKSDSVARDLLYAFDTVRYFYDAHLAGVTGGPAQSGLDKWAYIERRALWEAFAQAKERQVPQVLLIDEIDKAPRDFPNDLLHELDKMEFRIVEIADSAPITAPKHLSPIVFITSNSERRLPEPFLRRCVYQHIRFDDDLVERAVFQRRSEYASLSDSFLKLAIQRFITLRERSLRKKPATSELLVWLRVLALTIGTEPERLKGDLVELPYLGVLLKDRQDIDDLSAGQI